MSEQTPSLDRPVIRVAICGEVRAGKSALLNALFRDHILADNLGRDDRPMVFASYGTPASVQYLDVEGQEYATLDALGAGALASIQVLHDKDDLAAFEFVELPLTNAEELDDHHRALIRSSDIMIWVTIASQAWRLTEKTIIDELKDGRPKRAILAVSRGDKLRRATDRDKIMGRMRRETVGYFEEVALVTNSKAQIETTQADHAAWQASGAGQIARLLAKMSEEVYADMARAAREAEEAAAEAEEAEAAKEAAREAAREAEARAVQEAEARAAREAEARAAREAEARAAREAEARAAREAEEQAAREAEEQAAREAELAPRAADPIAAAAGDLIDAAGADTLIGMYAASAPADCVVLKGDPNACEAVGAKVRDLATRWLTAYGIEGADVEFGVVMHSASQSLHYRMVRNHPSVFLIAPSAQLSRGAAQIKHSQICDAIASVA